MSYYAFLILCCAISTSLLARIKCLITTRLMFFSVHFQQQRLLVDKHDGLSMRWEQTILGVIDQMVCFTRCYFMLQIQIHWYNHPHPSVETTEMCKETKINSDSGWWWWWDGQRVCWDCHMTLTSVLRHLREMIDTCFDPLLSESPSHNGSTVGVLGVFFY